MIGPGRYDAHGQHRLMEKTSTTITNKDTYVKVLGNFEDGETKGFEFIANKLCWQGSSGTVFLFNGSSDLEVNKACTISYGLFLNGVLVEEAQTPHSFVSPSKTSNISITALVRLQQDDEIEVFVKSSEDNTIVTVHTLAITLWI